ncbi:hypothetical protein NKDENANG_02026 [Candidatus Entotheonellaceae bacterium PAL068K]
MTVWVDERRFPCRRIPTCRSCPFRTFRNRFGLSSPVTCSDGYVCSPSSLFSTAVFASFYSRFTSGTLAPTCGLGKSPIQPVMISRCLWAAGVRFLPLPIPARELALPYGRVTRYPRTLSGLSGSADPSYDRFRCPLYDEGWGVLARTNLVPFSHLPYQPETFLGPSTLWLLRVTTLLPRIHFRSPCRSLPCPGRRVESDVHWAFISASHPPPVAGGACGIGNQSVH